MDHRSTSLLTRRRFLSGIGAGVVSASTMCTPAMAAQIARPAPTARTAAMVHQRTGESFAMTFHDGQGYLDQAVDAFSHFARDLRADAATRMDLRLLDLVHLIQRHLDDDSPLILTNGYRTAATNARTRRAAAGSLHVKGRALDLAHPRASTAALHRAAAQINQGGLGRYRTFIHIDTGPDRRW